MKRRIAETFLMIGAVYRALTFTGPALWYDEAFTLELARRPLFDMIRLAISDFSPPLLEIVVAPFVRISESLFALRFPSLAASILALWLIWLILNELQATDSQRLFICALVAFVPAGLWMASDTRVYAILSALYLAAAFFAIRGQWLGLTAACGLMLCAHITAPAFVVGCLALALMLHPAEWRKVALSGVGASLALIPWAATLTQGAGAEDFWLWPLTLPAFTNSLGYAIWAGAFEGLPLILSMLLLGFYLLMAISITISVSAPLLFRAASKNTETVRGILRLSKWSAPLADKVNAPKPVSKRDGDQLISPLAVLVFVPLALFLGVSVFYANVTYYRPLMVLVFPLFMWVGSATAPSEFKPGKLILPGLWGLVLIAGLVSYNPARKGGELDAMSAHINDNWRAGDVVYYVTGTAALPFDYYLGDKPAYILDEELHAGLLQTHLQEAFGYRRAALESLDCQRAWVIWPADPMIDDTARERMAGEIGRGRFNLVGIVDYWQAADIEVYLVEGACDVDM